MFTILFVRHGLTAYNLEGRLAGRTAVPLHERGRQQIAALVPAVFALKPDALYSSPLLRTRESAAILAGATGLPMYMLAELTEHEPGEWQGQKIADLEKTSESWKAFHRDPLAVTPAGGESVQAEQERMVAAVELIRQAGHKCAVVVSHGDPIRIALCHYLGIPLRQMHSVEVFPGTLSALSLDKERAQLWLLNHPGPSLPAAGPPQQKPEEERKPEEEKKEGSAPAEGQQPAGQGVD